MEKNQNIFVKPEQAKDFYTKGRDWEADRQARLEKSEKRAWMVAGIALTAAFCAIAGMALMAPFKQTVPYVFAIDKTSGNVEFVSAADNRSVMGYQELLDKHWATKYVTARESYFYKLLQTDYDNVLAMSGEDVARQYAKQFEGVDAIDKKLGANIEIKTKIISVTLAHDAIGSKAVVRFEKTMRRGQAEISEPPQYFVATFAYEYKPSMFGQEKDLIQNPLGYRVTSYRVDAEINSTQNNPQATISPISLQQ